MKRLLMCGACVVLLGSAAKACEPAVVVTQAYAPAVVVSPLAVAVAPVAVCHAAPVVVQQQVVQQQVVVRQRPRVVSQFSLSLSRVRIR